MGIDVYLSWPGMTEADKKKRITGFSTTAGNIGYLREAYHGGPYVTKVLMPEGWDDKVEENDDGFELPAKTMRERLPVAVMTALYRNHIVYEQGEDPAHIEMTGRVGELGPELLGKLKGVFASMNDVSHLECVRRSTPEMIEQCKAVIEKRNLPDYALAFVDFVRLAEIKEAETGKPCRVCVSA